MLFFNHKGREGFSKRAGLKAKKPSFIDSPTTEAVGSRFYNIFVTNGFNCWSTTLVQAVTGLYRLCGLPRLFPQTGMPYLKKFPSLISITVTFALLISSLPVFPQLSQGGLPAGIVHHAGKPAAVVALPTPDMAVIRAEDDDGEKQGMPRRVAVSVRAGINPHDHGHKETLPAGVTVLTSFITCEGALAMGFHFENFRLPPGARLFIYDEARARILGAYTVINNKPHGRFSTELIPGDRAIVEFNLDPGVSLPPELALSEISYLYRDLPGFLSGRGSSDDCEVNINCPEGEAWQKQKRGVARIYVKRLSSYFWCTGSLVNNTAKDLTPFFLTADHCAPDVSQTDLSQWVFYFNYEAPGCENPAVNPVPGSLSGAIRLANAGTEGSDFLLIRFEDEVPVSYGPFFNGWSRENIASPNGVTIHHPSGDIRKISTYTQPLVSSQWGGTPGTHWEVIWAKTVTNWGVTEGGSSGSPLFDMNGRIIGTLTGGMAACDPGGNGPGTGPDKPDYYGKFSHSWDQNGAEAGRQLKPWLDPLNTDVMTLAGMNSVLTAAFEADERIILAGGSVNFTNLSSGLPVSWQWTFEGGNPASYSGSQPPLVTYSSAGRFDVGLVVTDGENADTLLYNDYIQVAGQVFPNPTNGLAYIYLDEALPSPVQVVVYNLTGFKVRQRDIPEQVSRLVPVDLSGLAAGIYIVRLQLKQRYVFAKVIKVEF